MKPHGGFMRPESHAERSEPTLKLVFADVLTLEAVMLFLLGAIAAMVRARVGGFAVSLGLFGGLTVAAFLLARHRPRLVLLGLIAFDAVTYAFEGGSLGVQIQKGLAGGIALVGAALGAGLAVAVVSRGPMSVLRRAAAARPMLYMTLAYCCVALLSTIVALVPAASIQEWSRIPQFLVLFVLTVVVFRRREDFLALIGVHALILFVYTVLGVWKYARGEQFFAATQALEFLPLLICGAWYVSSVSSGTKAGALLLALAAAASFILTTTESRRVLFGVAMAWLLFALRLRSKGLVLVIILLGAGSLAVDRLPDHARERMEKSLAVLAVVGEQGAEGVGYIQGRNFMNLRDKLWTSAWHMYTDYPVLGVGLMNSVELMPRYGAREGYMLGKFRVHNLFLQVAADMGTVGFAALLALLGAWLWSLWQAQRHWLALADEPMQWVTYGLFASALLVLATGMVGRWGPYDKRDWYYYGLAAALLLTARASGRSLLMATLRMRQARARHLAGSGKH